MPQPPNFPGASAVTICNKLPRPSKNKIKNLSVAPVPQLQIEYSLEESPGSPSSLRSSDSRKFRLLQPVFFHTPRRATRRPTPNPIRCVSTPAFSAFLTISHRIFVCSTLNSLLLSCSRRTRLPVSSEEKSVSVPSVVIFRLPTGLPGLPRHRWAASGSPPLVLVRLRIKKICGEKKARRRYLLVCWRYTSVSRAGEMSGLSSRVFTTSPSSL